MAAAGKFLWDGMKTEIENAFGAAPDRGAATLVEALRAAWQDGIKPKVTLVGHSAGGIYVARLLHALNDKMPEDFSVNVVLIAPACTFTTLADALQAAGKRVRDMRIFGRATRSSSRMRWCRSSIPRRCSISSPACWRRRATHRSPVWRAITPMGQGGETPKAVSIGSKTRL